MKKSTIPMTCLTISKKVNNGTMRFDLPFQRRSVWKLNKKQQWIESLIIDSLALPIVCVDQNDNFNWVLDGQQRCLAIAGFINGDFSLASNMEEFSDEDEGTFNLAGMKYLDLPDSIRTVFNARNITVYTYKNLTYKQMEKMFISVNSGEPFKRIELTRVKAGEKVMSFVNSISNMEFFQKKIAISDVGKLHFPDHDVIFKALALMENEDINFSGNAIEAFAIELDGELTDDLKTAMIETTEYLNMVFDRPARYLKRGNIPFVMYIANRARQDGKHPSDLFTMIDAFFTSLTKESEYTIASETDSAKRAQVTRRLNLIMDAYNNM